MVLGLEMEVQAMETKTRQDAMEYPTRSHISTAHAEDKHRIPLVSTTFGAVTNGDAMVTLRFAP